VLIKHYKNYKVTAMIFNTFQLSISIVIQTMTIRRTQIVTICYLKDSRLLNYAEEAYVFFLVYTTELISWFSQQNDIRTSFVMFFFIFRIACIISHTLHVYFYCHVINTYCHVIWAMYLVSEIFPKYCWEKSNSLHV